LENVVRLGARVLRDQLALKEKMAQRDTLAQPERMEQLELLVPAEQRVKLAVLVAVVQQDCLVWKEAQDNRAIAEQRE